VRKAILITALLSSAATYALTQVTNMPSQNKLENARVRITEIIVFLDESRYERKDSATGEKTVRERKSGDVIWHDKGEDAPQLTNLGSRPYRTLVIELK
jgi:hypothetical protein